jgi:hypothetical protein
MTGLIKILLAGAAIILSQLAAAQDKCALDIGPKIGVNLSSFSNDNSMSKTGPAAGVAATYRKNNKGLSAELLYSFKGQMLDKSAEHIGSRHSTELRYIELPVHAMIFLPGKTIRAKAGAGAYMQMLAGGTETIMTGIDTSTFDPVIIETRASGYRTFDAGLSATAGFDIKLWEEAWITTDLRYGHGLFDVLPGEDVKQENRSWSVLVGVAFPLMKQSANNKR